MSNTLDDLAKKHGFDLDSGYRTYLRTTPKGGLAEWEGSAAGTPESPAMIGEVPGLFSEEELVAHLSENKLYFWHHKLLQHAYVIAKSYGGDPVVQVARGKHAGKVLLTNHENLYGGFQFLAEVPAGDRDDAEEFAEAAGLESLDELAELSTDQVVEILLNEELDGAIELGQSFAAFHRNLLAAHAQKAATES